MTTAHRVLLSVLIVAGVLLFMVLPWVFLFHSPEQFGGWAVTGVVLAVALHLFLSRQKRRRDLEQLMDEEADEDAERPDSA